MAEFAHVQPRAAAAHVRTDDAGNSRRGGAVSGQYPPVRPVGQMDGEWLEVHIRRGCRASVDRVATNVRALQLTVAGRYIRSARVTVV